MILIVGWTLSVALCARVLCAFPAEWGWAIFIFEEAGSCVRQCLLGFTAVRN